MITPKALNIGDRIAIVATARKISLEEIEAAIKTFTDWGLEVVLGDNLFKTDHQFAGTDEERTADLQQMLDDNSIKAIISARGGYGTVRIIDKLDFSGFVSNPKWIVGYSDVTVLHSHIYTNFGIQTLHATMPLNFKDASTDALESLRKALFGEKVEYNFDPGTLSRPGKAKGVLTGGNLSILYSLIGTVSDIDTDGKILFIEDLDEYLYHVDRMMMNLKRAGKLSNLAGLVVGALSKMNDNAISFGKTAEEVVFDAVKEYDYPVAFGFPAGHINDNRALIIGRKAKIVVGKKCFLGF
jgi:muramoyltetrapeptide carboxypeptidase